VTAVTVILNLHGIIEVHKTKAKQPQVDSGGRVRMLEKIGLAIAIAVSLYWTTEVRPPRAMAIKTEAVATVYQPEQLPVFVMI
jgi:hypothetical protein